MIDCVLNDKRGSQTCDVCIENGKENEFQIIELLGATLAKYYDSRYFVSSHQNSGWKTSVFTITYEQFQCLYDYKLFHGIHSSHNSRCNRKPITLHHEPKLFDQPGPI